MSEGTLDARAEGGSFPPDDVRFLLTELRARRGSTGRLPEEENFDRPVRTEFVPSRQYISAVRRYLVGSAERVAWLCAALAEQLLAWRGPDLVLVSIARAGTPVGVLVRRWMRHRYGLDVPHYSISSAGDSGLDLRAIDWLCRRYDPSRVQFIDGWTSKGTVREAVQEARTQLQFSALNPSLAVLADPAWAADVCATHDDVLFPHACLAATMSGLLSRTTSRHPLLAEGDFHGVEFLAGAAADDLSNAYVDAVASRYAEINPEARGGDGVRPPGPWGRGMSHASFLAREHGRQELDLINIGISESARAFFRRRPDLLILTPDHGEDVRLLLMLAAERDVPVVRDCTLPFRAALL